MRRPHWISELGPQAARRRDSVASSRNVNERSSKCAAMSSRSAFRRKSSAAVTASPSPVCRPRRRGSSRRASRGSLRRGAPTRSAGRACAAPGRRACTRSRGVRPSSMTSSTSPPGAMRRNSCASGNAAQIAPSTSRQMPSGPSGAVGELRRVVKRSVGRDREAGDATTERLGDDHRAAVGSDDAPVREAHLLGDDPGRAVRLDEHDDTLRIRVRRVGADVRVAARVDDHVVARVGDEAAEIGVDAQLGSVPAEDLGLEHRHDQQ